MLSAETAAYPELRVVVLMHNDNLSYGDTFDEALEGILGEAEKSGLEKRTVVSDEKEATDVLIKRVSEAFDNYLENMGQKNFESASEELETMRRILNKLIEK